MKIIDKVGIGIAILIDENEKVIGVITDGDIRRAILKGADLNSSILDEVKFNFFKIQNEEPNHVILQILQKEKIDQIPELDLDGKLKVIHTYSSLTANIDKKTVKIEEKKVKKILVIGGMGYVGHHVISILLDRGYSVRCLDVKMYQFHEKIKHSAYNPAVDLVIGDMGSIPTLIECLTGVDAVIHLGAVVGDPVSAENPETAIGANFLSSALIAITCKYFQINRLVFISTCSVYGAGDGWLTEESSLNPVSLYGRNKVESEKAILSLIDSNFQPTILRFGTIFGLSGRMRFDLVINLLTAKALSEGIITIFGGDQFRPFVHVRDASMAVIKVLEAPLSVVGGEIYNVGFNDLNLQIKELGPILQKNYPNVKVNHETLNVDLRDYRVNFSKIHSDLDFAKHYTIEDGIREISKFITEYDINYEDPEYSNVKSFQTNGKIDVND